MATKNTETAKPKSRGAGNPRDGGSDDGHGREQHQALVALPVASPPDRCRDEDGEQDQFDDRNRKEGDRVDTRRRRSTRGGERRPQAHHDHRGREQGPGDTQAAVDRHPPSCGTSVDTARSHADTRERSGSARRDRIATTA
jgi:hypothetical protein